LYRYITARAVKAGDELVWSYFKGFSGDKSWRCIRCCGKRSLKFPGAGADDGFKEAKPPPPRPAPKPAKSSKPPPIPKQKQKREEKGGAQKLREKKEKEKE
jgi:hypothetical protein